MTNEQFAMTNIPFLEACKIVQTLNGYEYFKPTKRQASKWRNKKGMAYKYRNRKIKETQ